MTALEYMEKQFAKHCKNYDAELKRGVPAEVLQNIQAKIWFYDAAVSALKRCVRDATKTSGETVTNRNGLTNADHIRSLTDEELAAFIDEVNYGGCSGYDHALDWLKQPYKEGAHE